MASGLKCYNCGKGIMIGHNVSHAKNRTRKIFKPNLHAARIATSGGLMRVRLCTKCLRMYKAEMNRLKTKTQVVEPSESIRQAQKEMSSIAPSAAGLV
jgi:large subunit ribosomal protein L28